ncbi:E3 ubiquitin protein ligase DRIP1 [Striga hermonthica]|uniref:E3 ubiquitin protein ligase DRIP1 n=1 Tax=Striga hermonthica TaxID=68872 RepID=A0A9N7NQB1_STRHE|nr:E3 ubiquitin protein ligase DRIP1 [Striga hermonthica]
MKRRGEQKNSAYEQSVGSQTSRVSGTESPEKTRLSQKRAATEEYDQNKRPSIMKSDKKGEKSRAANNVKDVAKMDPKLRQSTKGKKSEQMQERGSKVNARGRSKKKTDKAKADAENPTYNRKLETFWFSLVASETQKSKKPLEQIPSKYLRVKDGNMTVSFIKKYLVKKLNLSCEDEVEISVYGHELPVSMQIREVMEIWLQAAPASETRPAVVGSSAEDFLLTLTYGRKASSP